MEKGEPLTEGEPFTVSRLYAASLPLASLVGVLRGKQRACTKLRKPNVAQSPLVVVYQIRCNDKSLVEHEREARGKGVANYCKTRLRYSNIFSLRAALC